MSTLRWCSSCGAGTPTACAAPVDTVKIGRRPQEQPVKTGDEIPGFSMTGCPAAGVDPVADRFVRGPDGNPGNVLRTGCHAAGCRTRTACRPAAAACDSCGSLRPGRAAGAGTVQAPYQNTTGAVRSHSSAIQPGHSFAMVSSDRVRYPDRETRSPGKRIPRKQQVPGQVFQRRQRARRPRVQRRGFDDFRLVNFGAVAHDHAPRKD